MLLVRICLETPESSVYYANQKKVKIIRNVMYAVQVVLFLATGYFYFKEGLTQVKISSDQLDSLIQFMVLKGFIIAVRITLSGILLLQLIYFIRKKTKVTILTEGKVTFQIKLFKFWLYFVFILQFSYINLRQIIDILRCFY